MVNFKKNSIIFLSFIFLFYFYYPGIDIGIIYFHNDDQSLFQILSELSGITDYLNFIFQATHYKFRPIANFQYLVEFLLFRDSINFYILYNIFLLLLIVLIIIKFINIDNYFFTLIISFVVISSKFFVYSIWNITGSFESLSNIFFLLTISHIFSRQKLSFNHFFLILTLLLFTNERYLPFILLSPFLYFYFGYKYSLILSLKKSVIPFSILMILFILPRHYFGIPFFVGSQTDVITSSFDLMRFFSHLKISITELLGFSNNPRHLTGFEFPWWISFSEWDQKIKIIYFIQLVIMLLSLTFVNFGRKYNHFFIIIILSIIIAASITFRVEIRWLTPAFLIIILFIIDYVNNLDNLTLANNLSKKIFSTIFSYRYYILLIIYFAFNIYYLTHFRSSLYFAGLLDDVCIRRFYP